MSTLVSTFESKNPFKPLRSQRPQISELNRIQKLIQIPPDRSLRAPLPPEWHLALSRPTPYTQFNRSKLAERKQQLTQQVLNQLSPYAEIADFKHHYWIEGASSAIVMLGLRNDHVYYLRHDYTWLQTLKNFIPVASLSEVPKGSCFYISQPFAPICDYINLSQLNDRPDIKLLVDLAFWGATSPEPIHLPNNTKWIALSFTKNLGLWSSRIGMLLSKEEISPLVAYDNALYLPFVGMQSVDTILQSWNLFSLQDYLRPLQLEICQRLNLLACNCPLAGQESPWSYRRSISAELHEAMNRRT